MCGGNVYITFLTYVDLCFVKCVYISVTTVCAYCTYSLILSSLVDHYLKITVHCNSVCMPNIFHGCVECNHAAMPVISFVGQVTCLDSFFFLPLAIKQLMLNTNSLLFHLFSRTIKLPPPSFFSIYLLFNKHLFSTCYMSGIILVLGIPWWTR